MAKKGGGASYYAVAKGRQTGIYLTWDECTQQVTGFTGAKFKKFASKEEAQRFVAQGSPAGQTVAETSAGSSADQESERGAGKRGRTDGELGARPAKKSKHAVKAEEDMSAVEHRPTQSPAGVRIIDVYTDGASSSNGQEGARAGWGVHFPEGAADVKSDLHGLDESGKLDGDLQTNNRAELMGIIRAIELCPDKDAQLRIYSDSQYCIKAMNEWASKWRDNKWKLSSGEDVKNRDLIRHLRKLMIGCRHRPQLIHVKGHSTNRGNIEADRLAVAGATLPEIPKSEWLDREPSPSDDESGRGRPKTTTLASFGFHRSQSAK